MPEVTTDTAKNTNAKPKAKRAPRKSGLTRTSTGVVFASFGDALVKSGRVSDRGTAMKRVRASARSLHAEMCKKDKGLKRAKPNANDGNRWPQTLNASAAKLLADRLRVS